MSHNDTRDARAIAQIACPCCHAPAGTPCKRGPEQRRQHRPGCCTQRRKAYQTRDRSQERSQ
jgi:hypothetical protein